jgi:hypothetical protein
MFPESRSPLSFRATNGVEESAFALSPRSLKARGRTPVHLHLFPNLPDLPLSFRATNGSRGICGCSLTAQPRSPKKDTGPSAYVPESPRSPLVIPSDQRESRNLQLLFHGATSKLMKDIADVRPWPTNLDKLKPRPNFSPPARVCSEMNIPIRQRASV